MDRRRRIVDAGRVLGLVIALAMAPVDPLPGEDSSAAPPIELEPVPKSAAGPVPGPNAEAGPPPTALQAPPPPDVAPQQRAPRRGRAFLIAGGLVTGLGVAATTIGIVAVSRQSEGGAWWFVVAAPHVAAGAALLAVGARRERRHRAYHANHARLRWAPHVWGSPQGGQAGVTLRF